MVDANFFFYFRLRHVTKLSIQVILTAVDSLLILLLVKCDKECFKFSLSVKWQWRGNCSLHYYFNNINQIFHVQFLYNTRHCHGQLELNPSLTAGGSYY